MPYIPAWAGMTIRQNRRSFHIPARPLLDSGLRRNDDGVLFWLSVILSACNRQGFVSNLDEVTLVAGRRKLESMRRGRDVKWNSAGMTTKGQTHFINNRRVKKGA